MRDFFNSTRFKVLVAVALVLLGLMLRAATADGVATLPQRMLGAVSAPVQKLSAAISGTAKSALSSVAGYIALKKENEKLRGEVSQLKSKLMDYNTAMLQNKQYRAYLGIKKDNPDMKFVPAMVISRDSGQWYSSFTIDQGQLNGVKVRDCVITSGGLVGWVTEVMSTSSVVTTILDTSVQVGGRDNATGDACISQGVGRLLKKGELRFSALSPNSKAAKGDIVVTNGVGGVYPKGLRMGVVQSVKLSADGLSKNAVAKPAVDPSKVHNVFVVTSFKGKGQS